MFSQAILSRGVVQLTSASSTRVMSGDLTRTHFRQRRKQREFNMMDQKKSFVPKGDFAYVIQGTI